MPFGPTAFGMAPTEWYWSGRTACHQRRPEYEVRKLLRNKAVGRIVKTDGFG